MHRRRRISGIVANAAALPAAPDDTLAGAPLAAAALASARVLLRRASSSDESAVAVRAAAEATAPAMGFAAWVAELGRRRLADSEAALALEVHLTQLRTWLLVVRRRRGGEEGKGEKLGSRVAALPCDAAQAMLQFLGQDVGMPCGLGAEWHRQRVVRARLKRKAEEMEAERELSILVPQFIMKVIKPQLDAAADLERSHAFVDVAPPGDAAAKRIQALAKKLQNSPTSTSVEGVLKRHGYQVEACGDKYRKVSWV